MKSINARQISQILGATFKGFAERTVHNVASLDEAGENDLSFFSNQRYRSSLSSSKAAIVLVPEKYTASPPQHQTWVYCQSPSEGLNHIIDLYFAPNSIQRSPGIHSTAVIAKNAFIHPSVYIGPCVVVEAHVYIGSGSIIEAGVYIGPESNIGQQCHLFPHVSIRERTLLGNNVIIHCNTVIGSDGFGFIQNEAGHTKISQIGIVKIDDDVEIGAGVCIDRARFGRTWIQKGVKIDNLVQIGHNVVIEKNSIIVAQVGIAGSVHVGKNVIIAGQAGIPEHLKIGEKAVIAARSVPFSDLDPGLVVMGIPAAPRWQCLRQNIHLQRLPSYIERLKGLEEKVEGLQSKLLSSSLH